MKSSTAIIFIGIFIFFSRLLILGYSRSSSTTTMTSLCENAFRRTGHCVKRNPEFNSLGYVIGGCCTRPRILAQTPGAVPRPHSAFATRNRGTAGLAPGRSSAGGEGRLRVWRWGIRGKKNLLVKRIRRSWPKVPIRRIGITINELYSYSHANVDAYRTLLIEMPREAIELYARLVANPPKDIARASEYLGLRMPVLNVQLRRDREGLRARRLHRFAKGRLRLTTSISKRAFNTICRRQRSCCCTSGNSEGN